MFDRDLWQEAKSQRLLLTVTLAVNAATAACTVLQAFLLSRIISAVFLSDARLSDTRNALAVLLAVIIARASLISVGEAAAGALALRVKRALRVRLFRHLHALGPTFVQSERSGELINTLTEGIESLDAYFSQYLPQLAIAVLAPLIIVVAVATGDLLSAAILLLTAPLIPIFMMLVGHGTRRVTQRQWRLLNHMSAHFLDVLQGLTTLKILGQSRAQIAKVATYSRQLGRATMRVLRVSFLSALVLELVATLSVAIIAVETGLRLLNGALSFPDALFILILAPEFYLPLRMLGARFHAGMSGVAASQRLFSLLQLPAAPLAQTGAEPENELATPSPIRFNNVSYAFAGGERPALSGISLHIEPGSHVAIVGPSGAGKSTLLRLLLQFITPQDGEILVGDESLENIEPQHWLRQVAWVPQKPHLFNDTVSANIALGDPDADLEAIVAAAKRAGAHGFISQLPKGYESPIGEKGFRLSGGQAQRLALARALLKDAPILVLDEPTAHLDLENERSFHQALEASGQGRTIITITHRLNTTQHADRVVLMDQGRIVQEFNNPGHATNGKSRRPTAYAIASRSSSTCRAPLKIQTNGTAPPSAVRGLPSPTTPPSVSTIDALQWLASFIIRHKRWLFVSTLLGFLTIASTIGLLGTSAYLISLAALQPSIAALGISIVAVRFFGLARGIGRYLERLATHETTFRILAQLRTWTFATLEPLAPAHLPSAGSGDLLARLVSDVSTLEQFYVRALAPPMVALVVLFAVSIFMATFHWPLALILAGFMIVAGLVLPLSMHFAGRHAARETVDIRAALHARLVDGIQGTGDLTAFGQLDRFARSIEQLSERFMSSQARLVRLTALQEGLSALLANLAAWVILLLAVSRVDAGRLDGLLLATLVLVTLASFEATLPLSQAVQHIQSSLQSAKRLLILNRIPPPVSEPGVPGALPQQPGLRVQNLTFHYAASVPPVLRDINLDIPLGKRLAIVGASGAGKTTLFNLLLRLWDFQEGRILLDGQNIRDFSPADVRTLFSVVSQNSDLFNASIADNIRLARPGASMEDVFTAARTAQIHDFIASLPEGYETVIGEQGYRLSGGQRQRLAMARALLTPAPIFLLDEPTANLDAETAQTLLQTMYNALERKTMVLITHRLLLMEQFDEIVVLVGGQVRERGTHDALLRHNGLYARMWRLQEVYPQVAGARADDPAKSPAATYL